VGSQAESLFANLLMSALVFSTPALSTAGINGSNAYAGAHTVALTHSNPRLATAHELSKQLHLDQY
jgi:hypothetical protein